MADPYDADPYDASQYDASPYVTLRHELLLRDPTLTVAEKFVDDKELEVSDSLRRIPLIFAEAGVQGLMTDEQQGAYINKITFLISPVIKNNSFLEKTIRIATLMSALTERHDNRRNGGKDMKHPLYLVSRFIPEDSEATGCCVFRIDIRPPREPTNFLRDEYNRFKALLKHHGVKSELENYPGAMSKANWVRKMLVVYVKLNIHFNNEGRFEIVEKTGTHTQGAVVDYVSFRVHYGTTADIPQVPCFSPHTLSEWCNNAMEWVAGILDDQSERKFKKTNLYEMIEEDGPPMEDPEPDDGSDLMAWLLRERTKKPKLNQPGDGDAAANAPAPAPDPPGDHDDDDGEGHSSQSGSEDSDHSKDSDSSWVDSDEEKRRRKEEEESKESELWDVLSELALDDTDVPWVGKDIAVDTPKASMLEIFQATWRLNNETYYTVKDLLLQQGDNCTVTDQVLDDLKRQNKIFREAYRTIMTLIQEDDESILSL
jgi:hypothetical protein